MADDQQALATFEKALKCSPGLPGDLIPLLQAAQMNFGFVSDQAMVMIGDRLEVPMAEVYGVATFYKQFRFTPRGRYMIRVCDGTACHVNDSVTLIDTIEEVLGVKPGETDAELNFTLETVACLGCCSLAPVIVINEETHGRLNPQKLRKLMKTLKKEANAPQTEKGEA